ncbi:hypothetical protein LLP99_17220 [Rouxiella badensis]|uniref:hypothetical protein n=1 Tax=Rouxiella badensis TaxID=1646377 RepID=UPI001D13B944|nr:hypothetical protein [Rouxiella badensis]MCC3717932.1 hypothetical protein [Rouxiella badensis]MCC3730053.1 hypothetical protein [Rouxiella badensis]
MAKSAAERKAAQRARLEAAGVRKIELELDAQEVEMLAQNCAARRPFREPYGMAEYIALLIRKDNAELQAQLAERAKRKCTRCSDALPGDAAGCPLQGEAACWQTFGHLETKLML